jgi:hypothetical protein
MAVAITWRLPVTVNALARHPALAAAEMITLVARAPIDQVDRDVDAELGDASRARKLSSG